MNSVPLSAYADLLLDYCTEVQPGDVVGLHVDLPAVDVARALVRGAFQRDAIPVVHIAYPEWVQDVVECAGDAFMQGRPAIELGEIEATQAWIRVGAPTNSRDLQSADPARLARFERRMRPVQEHRVEHTRWVGTLFPTASGAQDAGMSLDAYTAFAVRAMFLDRPDPVAAWTALERDQARWIDRLSQANEVRIVGDRTDLRMSVKGRVWVNSSGRRNMPSGEVFTGPIEDSAEGTIYFGIPSFVAGREVRGVTLRFEGGAVVEGHAEVGDDLLQERLQRDAGARRLGELGIGTHEGIDRPTGSTLYDEKIGGTVHLALGRSYTSTGGTNESSIHWDLVCDLRGGGSLIVDGEEIQRNGSFVI